MTLDCKPRRLYPASGSTSLIQNPPRFVSDAPAHSNGGFRISHSDRSTSIGVHHHNKSSLEMGENRRESFLQRLLEIERRHDEKRMAAMRRRTGRSGNEDPGMMKDTVQIPESVFPKSPTRWISEQILDDTQETNSLTNEGLQLFRHNKSFNKSTYSRLPSLSDVHRMTSSCTNVSSSSPFTHRDSLSSNSDGDLPRSNDTHFHNRPQTKKRPLRLPPILLPPIYAVRPRPLKERDFLTPTHIRGPITEEEWDDLQSCRYIRPAPPRFALPLSTSQMSLL